MRKALIIFLLFVLPWHAMAAAQRSLGHVMGAQGKATVLVFKHAAEHASYVPHHHDEDGVDGDSHEDNSQKSFQHLADFEQGCAVHMLAATPADFTIGYAPRLAPEMHPESYSDRTTIPLLRPPRVRA